MDAKFSRAGERGVFAAEPAATGVMKPTNHHEPIIAHEVDKKFVDRCAEQDALRQEYQAAVENYRMALGILAALVDNSATAQELNLAHWQIQATRGLCDTAQAALKRHQARHGCVEN
jgi:hypothetical protein